MTQPQLHLRILDHRLQRAYRSVSKSRVSVSSLNHGAQVIQNLIAKLRYQNATQRVQHACLFHVVSCLSVKVGYHLHCPFVKVPTALQCFSLPETCRYGLIGVHQDGVGFEQFFLQAGDYAILVYIARELGQLSLACFKFINPLPETDNLWRFICWRPGFLCCRQPFLKEVVLIFECFKVFPVILNLSGQRADRTFTANRWQRLGLAAKPEYNHQKRGGGKENGNNGEQSVHE